MIKNDKLRTSKSVDLRVSTAFYISLFFASALAISFSFLAFMDSFTVVSETLENVYYSSIEIALGTAGIDLNAFFFSGLTAGAIASAFTLIAAIILASTKRFSPWVASLLALAVALFSIALVMCVFFRSIISSSLIDISDPTATLVATWPIYLMSAFSGGALLIDLAILLYAAIDAYARGPEKAAPKS